MKPVHKFRFIVLGVDRNLLKLYDTIDEITYDESKKLVLEIVLLLTTEPGNQCLTEYVGQIFVYSCDGNFFLGINNLHVRCSQQWVTCSGESG